MKSFLEIKTKKFLSERERESKSGKSAFSLLFCIKFFFQYIKIQKAKINI